MRVTPVALRPDRARKFFVTVASGNSTTASEEDVRRAASR